MAGAALSTFDLTGRVALVIGGTSGLGRASALALAEAGADVVATGRRAAEVESVYQDILATGRRSLAQTCDATDRASLEEFRSAVLAEFGRVDILVYAAGRILKKPTLDLTLEEWDAVRTVNLEGLLLSCQTFYPDLKQSPYPRIVTFASLTSYRALHQVAAYSAAKAAVLSLTKSLGCEWGPDGIRVNAVVPGVFVTDLNRDILEGTPRGQELKMRTPLGRFGDASELTPTVVFLASDAASFITGAAIPVDGGFLASGVNQ